MNSRFLVNILISISVIALTVHLYRYYFVEREMVIVSTNDIHAQIDDIPRLATVLRQCRDTVETIYLDAGDRWTGNAFVDKADGRRPILDLLGELGCNVATLGNHEFDEGAQFLDTAIGYSSFETVCCNARSECRTLSGIRPYSTISLGSGLKIFVAGAVTNYCNGHPDGTDETFEHMSFPDPMEAAHAISDSGDGCDLKILLSHMGDDRDMEYASRYDDYDMIIGGHTHEVVDTLINGTRITQTGSRLKRCGITRVRFRGHTIESLTYENLDIRAIDKDEEFVAAVGKILSNPLFLQKIGSLKHELEADGVANLVLEATRAGSKADLSLYHRGGIRTSHLPEGDVTFGDICNIDPFCSTMSVYEMTPAMLRNVIVRKYNDTRNPKESHRVDLYCTTPYRIVTDQADHAFDVEFEGLKEDTSYRVAVCSYIAETYEGFETITAEEVTEEVVNIILSYLRERPMADIASGIRQTVVVRQETKIPQYGSKSR